MILVFPISSFCCEYIFNDKNMIMIKNLFMKWVLDFRTTSLGYKMVATWLAEYFLQVKKINGRTMFRLAKMQQSLCSQCYRLPSYLKPIRLSSLLTLEAFLYFAVLLVPSRQPQSQPPYNFLLISSIKSNRCGISFTILS